MSRLQLRLTSPAIRVVWDGQSLNNVPTPGNGTSCPEVAMSGLGYPFANVAINGASWAELTNATGEASGQPRSTRLYPQFTKHTGQSILVLLGGTSSVDEGLTSAQIMTAITDYADDARTAGADYVIGCTIPPSASHDASEDTEREGFNTLLKADAGGDFDAVVDITENEAGPLYDNTDATYYVDQVHWTATGAAYAAGLIRPALVTAIAALLA